MPKEITTEKGKVFLLDDPSVIIGIGSSFLDMAVNAPSKTLAIAKENLVNEFFDLRSGIAGEILQKVSNYKLRLIILGDFSGHTSQNFKDFVHESNRTGQVVFAGTLDEAVALLK